MLEIEMKFPVSDFATVQQQWREWGAEKGRPARGWTTTLTPPTAILLGPTSALRLRRIGQANFVTYKGPKQDTFTKTRTDIEVTPGRGISPWPRILAASSST